MKDLCINDNKLNNKGFSLVELLIAVAIAGIVAGSVFGFMTVGARTFGQSSSDVHLQNEAQLAFNQIQDMIIDTVVGIDYVYITGDNFSDDSNKVMSDAEIPATGVDGKKLIMYNSVASGRNVYEVVWKEADRKLYYNEYSVAVDSSTGVDKIVKGSRIGDADALMAEYVTGFSADLSQIESKRVAKIDISYEKNGRPYTSSHNITLRNKIVSGNEIPSFMVSENSVALSDRIDGPDEIFVEPGDVCVLNSSYTVVDINGNVTSGTKNWSMPPAVQAAGNNISIDGQLQVSNQQKNDFTLTVQSGDGLAVKTVDVKIMRITNIDGINWEHIGSVGEGEINGGTASADDLIAEEEFKLTASGISGSNIDKTSFNGNTVEDSIIFIKTKGEDLFTITKQTGGACECKMAGSFGNGSTEASGGDSGSGNSDEGLISWTTGGGGSSQSYITTDIGVVAVSVYSMGGRGFSETSISDFDLAASTTNYNSSSTSPVSIGASNYQPANRYYENGNPKAVECSWGGKAYSTNSNFNIGINDWQRGDHYPVSVMYQGKAVDLKDLKMMSDGTKIEWTRFFGIIDIKFTERNHKQDGTIVETVTKHYCPNDLTRGEGTHWGIECPEDYSANSDLIYSVTAYLIDKNTVNVNVNAGDCAVFGQVNGLTENDLKKAKYVSNTLPIKFDRLILAYERNNKKDTNIIISGDKNQNATYYPKEYGIEYVGDTQYKKTIKFTYSDQFKKAKNNFIATDKWNYYQEKNGGWVFYDEDNRKYSSGVNGRPKAEANDDKIEFTYLPRDINKNTPSHLRLVPNYEKNNLKEVLFENHIDVWVWNVLIPETYYNRIENNKTKKEKLIDEQVSYFPVPLDATNREEYEKTYLSSTDALWKGALATGNNKKTTAIYYTMTKIGEANAEKPSYKLTLKCINPDNSQKMEIATYECKYDDHMWVKK